MAWLAVWGCARARELDRGEACPSWKVEIAPVLADRCGECHGTSTTTGFRSDLYASAIESPLAAVLDPLAADAVHRPHADLHPLIVDWLTRCEAAWTDSRVHDPGIMNPRDPDFHGSELAAAGWDFDRCAKCHGADFSGGAARAACTTCHPKGPTACETCHGPEVIPSSGLHPAHVRRAGIACETCHTLPQSWDAPGHILADDGPPAEVRLEGTYDPCARRCSGVVCHGARIPDSGAAEPTPVWVEAPRVDRCALCHGDPPPDHASARCAACHPVPGKDALHIDGAVELAMRGPPPCGGCHGGDPTGLPPPDLDGAKETSTVTVGLHEAHARSPRRLRGPIDCSACHLLPARVDSPGHIDSDRPAEVFPAGFGGLAAADGASPRWDRARATCSGVYCHGGGRLLLRDASPSVIRELDWTNPEGLAVACGGCHGVPPQDGMHDPTSGVRGCARCHPGSVDERGAILIAPDGTSRHLDGHLDR